MPPLQETSNASIAIQFVSGGAQVVHDPNRPEPVNSGFQQGSVLRQGLGLNVSTGFLKQACLRSSICTYKLAVKSMDQQLGTPFYGLIQKTVGLRRYRRFLDVMIMLGDACGNHIVANRVYPPSPPQKDQTAYIVLSMVSVLGSFLLLGCC